MDFAKAIDAVRQETEKHGIELRRGKRYSTAAIRVEIARRHFGAISIRTEVLHYGRENGEPIMVRATIAAPGGEVLAIAHAEEIRGSSNVNRTSALENAETSAIGRALAVLGLNGGEFASAEDIADADKQRAAEQRQKPPAPEPPREAPAVTRDRLLAAIDGFDTLAMLVKFNGQAKVQDAIAALHAAAPPMALQVEAAIKKRHAALDPAGQAPEHMSPDEIVKGALKRMPAGFEDA